MSTKDIINTMLSTVSVSARQSERDHAVHLIVQETVSNGKTSSGQGRQTDPSALKPSSLASVKAIFGKIAVSQGLKVPSPDISASDA